MASQSENENDSNCAEGEAPTKRAPILARSTITGTVVGVGAGIVYMTLATHVKGSEWLFFALIGCVLGTLVGFIVDALKPHKPMTHSFDEISQHLWRSPFVWVAAFFGLIALTCWLAWVLLLTVIVEKHEINPKIAMAIALGGVISFVLSAVFGYAAKKN